MRARGDPFAQVAIAVVVGKLLATYLADPSAAAAAAARTEVVASGSFYMAMVGVVDIAFSFGGQINWWGGRDDLI